MQTLSSPSTTSSSSVPKKLTPFFENPLDRPELGPSEDLPMVSPFRPVITRVSETPATLPVIPAGGSTQKGNPPSSVAPGNKNTSSAGVTTRRELPDAIKAIFEKNSNLSAYAKNNGRNSEEKNSPVAEKTPDVLDEWDRALLLEIAPPEPQKPKRLSFPPAPSSVAIPKKTEAEKSGAVFPTRVMDSGIPSPIHRVELPSVPKQEVKPLSAPSLIPKKPENSLPIKLNNAVPKKIPVPSALAVPAKPKLLPENPITSSNSLPPLIPKKPSEQPLPGAHLMPAINRPKAPAPNMSETLVEKIIEGQMRGVFENAPPLLQKKLEKTAVQEIISPAHAQPDTLENDVWKKRLREYLVKIQGQATGAFPDANTANPNEGEEVLDYIKRVYPAILKAQVMK